MKNIYNILFCLLFVLHLMPVTLFAQVSFPKIICGKQIYIGKSFSEISLNNSNFKWFSSSSTYYGTEETYSQSGRIEDVYITFNKDEINQYIISQIISYQGNRTMTNNKFITAINEIKKYGGYLKIDAKTNFCRVFYEKLEIIVSISKIEKSPLYITTIECRIN